MNKTFIVEAGKLDSHGDIVNLSGLKLPDKKVVVLHNFDNRKPITSAEVFLEDGVLKAKGEVPEKYADLYPAIGFLVIKSETNEHGGKTILEAKLYCVGLSESPNTDETIKRISEQ